MYRALSEFDLNNISGMKDNLELVPGGSLNDVARHGVPFRWGSSQKVELVHQQFVKIAAAVIDQKQTKLVLYVITLSHVSY